MRLSRIEIENFKPREYWTLEGDLNRDKQDFVARLTHLHGEKLKQFSINNDGAAGQARTELLKSAGGKLVVEEVEKKQRKRSFHKPIASPVSYSPWSPSLTQAKRHKKILFLYRFINV